MELYDRILTKEEINSRFIEAVHVLLNKKMVADKASLAECLNSKPSKFSEILNGRMKAGVDMIAILCDYYNISPDWILMSRGGFFRQTELPPITVNQGPGSLEYIQQLQSESTKQDSAQTSLDSPANNALIELIKEQAKTIREQAEEIGSLREQIKQLKQERGHSASDANTSNIANAG